MIHLVRHDRADAPPRVCVGWSDPPLLDAAATAARMTVLAARIGQTEAVLASDLERAVQTALPLADALSAPLVLDARLREMCFGAWELRDWASIAATDPERHDAFMADWLRVRAPGGESVHDVRTRVAELATTLPSAAVIVAHGGSARLLAAWLLDLSVADALAEPLEPGHVIAIDGRRLVCWNAPPERV